MDANFSDVTVPLQSMLDATAARLPYLAAAAVAFLLALLLAIAVRRTARSFAGRAERRGNVGLVVGRLAYGAVVLLGILVALVIAVPGFTPGQLVNLLGLSSVAVGFAFRDILQNFLAGILLLLNEPFRVGDQIVLKDMEGTVEDIQTRATYLRTYDGRRIVIPNSELFQNSVYVNTAYPTRRVEYDVGIGYGDDLERARRVIQDALRSVPAVLDEPPPEVLVWELADSAIVLRLRWWIQPPKWLEVVHARDAVLAKVRVALAEAAIDVPFPTRQILFHDQTEDTDGDRARQREGWPSRGRNDPAPSRIGAALRSRRGPDRAQD